MGLRFCVDLDGTLCTNTFGEYEKALPIESAIQKVNSLFESDNLIRIFTARGSGSGTDLKEFTIKQLSSWGVKYHELILGKPEADFYIDDRGINFSDWIDSPRQDDYQFFQKSILKSSLSMLRGTSQVPKLVAAGNTMVKALSSGNKILWCGNGGSAADSQHLAAELVGRFAKNREPLASIALTTDTSILTALGNDYGYETIFSRQVKAIGKNGDVLIGISTSGESENVLQAIQAAKLLSISTIGFSGEKKNNLDDLVDISIKATSTITSYIQESHIAWGQALCGYIEENLFP